MPKTRSKNGTAKRKYNYRECDSSESEDQNELGMLSTLLQLFIQQRTPKKKRQSAGRPAKKKSGPATCTSHCQCCHCSKTVSKRNCSTQKNPRGRPKGTKTTKPSTSTKLDTAIELDSEEEVDTVIKESQADNIKSKVDNFFKDLESDEDELDKHSSTKTPPEEKTKEFYTLLSDSEDEKIMKKQDILESNKSKHSLNKIENFNSKATKSSTITSTSTTNSLLETITNCQDSNPNNKPSICSPKSNTDDLFAYVDNILNEYNTVIVDKPKEDVPELSLEDLKKKTDEILGDVASMIDDLTPKPQEPEEKVPKSPVKEAPMCPICFEQLGGSRQVMVTLCGHMFCEPCIQQVVKTTKKCPSCRKGVTKTKFHPVYI